MLRQKMYIYSLKAKYTTQILNDDVSYEISRVEFDRLTVLLTCGKLFSFALSEIPVIFNIFQQRSRALY